MDKHPDFTMLKSLRVHNANAPPPRAQESEASVREFVGPAVQDVLLLLPRLQPEDQGRYPLYPDN